MAKTKVKAKKKTKAKAKKDSEQMPVMDEIAELSEAYKVAHITAKEHEEKRKEFNKEKDGISIKICKLAERADLVAPFNLASGGKIFINDKISAKQVDKQALYNWLEANGHGDLVTVTVDTGSLKTFIKVLMKANKKTPDGVEVTSYQQASFRKK